MWTTSYPFAATLLLGACLCATPAAAQVRTEPAAPGLIDPADTAQASALFQRSGLFMIAGGVLPAGHAIFLLDAGGARMPVPASAITPEALPDGGVALAAGGRTYRVDMPAGLACPLGRFEARGGTIAYTVPKYIDPESRRDMLNQGLVHHRIAREFDNTPFAALLKAADYGATEKLPPGLEQRIVTGINERNNIEGLVLNAAADVDTIIGSYLNSGMQVTYRVYLMPQQSRVEIGGVPLRYYWKMDQDGVGGLFAAEIYAQNWGPGAHLTNWSAPGAQATQYDIVNFFQVAALFHELRQDNPTGFATFVDRSCTKAI